MGAATSSPRARQARVAPRPLAVLEQELGLLSYEALASAERALESWRARGYRGADTLAPRRTRRTCASSRTVRRCCSSRAASARRRPGRFGDRHASSRVTRAGRSRVTLPRRLAARASRSCPGLPPGSTRRRIERCWSSRRAVLARSAHDRRPRDRPRPRVSRPRTPRCRHGSPREGAVVSQFWPEAPPTRQASRLATR